MNKAKLESIMNEKNLDAVISLSEQTRLWMTTIQSSDGFLFIKKDETDLFLDGRYIEHGKKEAKNANVHLVAAGVFQEYAKNNPFKRIGIEEEYLTIKQLGFIKRLYPDAEYVNVSAAQFRIIKSKQEIEWLQKAADISMEAFNKIVPDVKAGVSEKELDAKLEMYIRQLGGEKGSFDAIIASGPRSALPHGRASDRVLQEGELVTIDFGAFYKGYASDITRTMHVGKVTDPKLLEIEAVLRESQRLGREAVRPGITTFEIDKICRDYIVEKGYGEFFVHSTGHGLGIDVHELPNVSANESISVPLEEGMVITVEPGIYLEGYGGIRVEDDIVVTKDGNYNLARNLYPEY